MAQEKRADQRQAGGADKSDGKGGGKSTSQSASVGEVAGNAKVRGEQPSPSGRDRGETSRADRP